ncbi:MAG: Rrf2 family transcriptional regulator [Bacteroidetes bacterium]|nr:Rrf2 family transcriptional regulator [Bacteroidota bacterium]
MLSKSCEYAIRAVLYLSIHSDEDKKIGIKIIAEELKIPGQFLNKILQKLVKKKIVYSTKGNTGGFYVDWEIRKMPVLKIVEVVDGLDGFQNCSMGLSKCSHKKPCAFHHTFQKHRMEMFNILKETNIDEMSTDIKKGTAFLIN